MRNKDNNIIIDETKSFAEKYSIDPSEYEKIDIIFADLSNIIIFNLTHCFNYKIISIADLLRLSPKQLTRFRNIGIASIEKIDKFIREIDIDRLISKQENTSTFNIIDYRNEILDGNFSFAKKISMTENDKKYIDKCKIGYKILGKELINKCCNSSSLMESTRLLLERMTYINRYSEKEEELNNVISLIPSHRKKRKAIFYLQVYFDNQEEINTYMKFFHNDADSLLANVDKIMLLNDFYACFNLTKFFKWCSFNIEKDINELISKIFSICNTRKIVQSRMNNISYDVISKEIHWSVAMTKSTFKQAVLKIEQYELLYSKLKRKINADYGQNKIFDIEDYNDYLLELDYLYQTTKISTIRCPKSLNEIIEFNRMLCGFTLDSLSNVTGINYQKLKDFEKGTALPSTSELEMLSKSLEEPIGTFKLNSAIKVFNLGGKLKYFRCESNLSIKEVSDRLNITEEMILSYETNKLLPNAVQIINLSSLYGVPEHLLNISSIRLASSPNILINYYRRKRGLSSKELAEKSDISARRILNIEKENTRIKQVEFIKIADVLNLSYQQLTHHNMTLGNRIEYNRQIKNLTIKELSELSNIKAGKIRAYENDKKTASISEYISLSKALNVSLQKLYPANLRNISGMSFGKYVNYYRVMQGVSIKEFSEITGFTENYIMRLEQDKVKLNRKKIERIAVAIRKNPSELISRYSF